VPSTGCRPEGPKYGKEAYFGYSGRHQVHMNLQPSPPLSSPVATPGKVSAAGAEKFMCYNAFIFVLIKLLNKLISKKTIIFENSFAKSLDCLIFLQHCQHFCNSLPLLFTFVAKINVVY
jgi:hypothetical protein